MLKVALNGYASLNEMTIFCSRVEATKYILENALPHFITIFSLTIQKLIVRFKHTSDTAVSKRDTFS